MAVSVLIPAWVLPVSELGAFYDILFSVCIDDDDLQMMYFFEAVTI